MQSTQVSVGRRQDLAKPLLDGMHRLRHTVFRDRLGWALPVVAGDDRDSDPGLERDEYDHCDPTYIVLHRDDSVYASCRLLRTTGRWMLPELWPEMLGGESVPCTPATWELSRFAVDVPDNGGPAAIGDATALLLHAAFEVAVANGVSSYIVVTGAGMDRLLRKVGLTMSRFGAPIRVAGSLIVASEVQLDEVTRSAISSAMPDSSGFNIEAMTPAMGRSVACN